MPPSLTRDGPPLEQLLHRLAESPADILAEPRIGRSGQVHVAAVVGDLLAALGARPDAAALAPFADADAGARNALSVTLLLCWLLADPSLAAAPADAGGLLRLLDEGARELAATPARRFVHDPDRREELVRVTLAARGMRPAGETQAQAEDRLASLSSTERARVVAAARDAELRARAIRDALRRKAAQESADKWSRE
jgi:hypothetical protein